MAVPLRDRRIIVTGASGLVGRRLCRELTAAGARVIRAVRGKVADPEHELAWDPQAGTIDAARFEGVDGVVHLAGENIADRRWSEDFKHKIRDSRVRGTELVCSAIARAAARPQTLVCASAIGYYGDRADELLNESSPPSHDFLGEVCQAWEAACQRARDAGVRTVNARIGVILSPEGGALKKMLTPFKLGLGGVLGGGRQYMSWVALDDVVGAIQFALAENSLSGPMNTTAPNPATNREFTKTLGQVLGRPTIFPVPAPVARLAFGEMADALLLASTRVEPAALKSANYPFRYPDLAPALRHLLDR